MKFLELHERLRLYLWRRIDEGVVSSSLLARQTGLAQAHISNYLHLHRRLSLPALDRILQALELGVEELLPESPDFPAVEGNQREPMDIVPVVSHALAITAPLIPVRAILGSLQLPPGMLAGLPARRAVSRRSWVRFIAVRISTPQAAPMEPLLRPRCIVVIDRHYNSLAMLRPPQPNIYGVRDGGHLLFRYVSFEDNRLLLRPHAVEHPVQLMELAPQESPSDLLVGRVCLCITEL